MKKNVLIILSLCFAFSVKAQCPATSLVGGHIIYNDISVSPVVWNNLPGAETSDNVRTSSGQTVPTNATINTSGIWAQTFLFSVPAAAVICGIEVRIERRQLGAIAGTSSVTDNSIKLVTSMTPSGIEHATGTPWAASDQIDVYGGSGDLWGLNLTPAEVNAADFGVAITAKLQNSGSSVSLSAQIDKISIMVYYTFPLPVELLHFTGEAQGRNVDLLWRVASETDNAEFIIERSVDAIHWTTVGTVAGGGTHNTETNYNWMDQHAPNGTLYYNLKQRNQNGEIQHLGSTTVTMVENDELDFQFNPSTSIVQVLGLENEMKADLNVLNVSGKTVFSTSTHNNENQLLLDEHLSSGIYFFELTSGNKRIVKKIIIHD